MEKLTLREHLGYSVASMGDSVAYVFIGSFLLFFLTTVAGIAPAAAGAISAMGTVFSALINPVIGYASDRVHSRFGRRRPALLYFSVPLGIVMLLLFTDVPLHGAVKILYYTVMLFLFWFVYTAFFVPYNALGAAYTTDYDERTKLRLFAALFNALGTLVCLGLPTILSAGLIARGFGAGAAWSCVGGLMGAVSAVTILITFFVSKEKDPPNLDTKDTENHSGETFRFGRLFQEYISVAMLPPIRWLIIASIASLIAYTMIMADVVYYLTYNLAFTAEAVSLGLLTITLFRALMLPLQGKLSALIDKRITIICFNLFAVAGFIFVRILDSDAIPAVIFFGLLAAIATGTYWAIIPSIYYDICDYDRLHNGKERQGTIISFQGLVESISAGAGSLLLGLILQFAGFDGASMVQSGAALAWIHNCTTLVPSVFLLIACFAVFKYPVTRRAYEEIRRQLAEKQTEK